MTYIDPCGQVCGIPKAEHQTEEHPWVPTENNQAPLEAISIGGAPHVHKFVAAPFTGQLGTRAYIFCETCGERRPMSEPRGTIVND